MSHRNGDFFSCEECGKEFYIKGKDIKLGFEIRYCSRACRYGPSPEVRFWRYVDKETYAPCWKWMAHRNMRRRGYGEFRPTKDSGLVPSHRFSWEMVHGPIPEGMFVCHNCPGGDNPWCVNPDHLWLGTPGDNSRDAWKKGTMKPPPLMKGEQNPRAALTEQQVREIRELIKTVPQKELAKRYGVTRPGIWHITHGLNWKHIL